MEINSLKILNEINTLKMKISNLQSDNSAMIAWAQGMGMLQAPQKRIEVTENTYNLRTRVYQWGNLVLFSVYTLNVSTTIPRGQLDYVLTSTNLPPLEQFSYMGETSTGERLTIQVTEEGVIRVGYVYTNIPVNSQIYFWGMYIAQNQITNNN